METVSARWTKHRPIAVAIADEWRIPGMDSDDIRQEALVALWEACRSYDRDRGKFPAWARLTIRSRLADLLEHATRQKRTAVLVRDVDVPGPDEREGREQLQLVLDVDLTPRERQAVADHLNGVPRTKAHDQALYRARVKLKAAA